MNHPKKDNYLFYPLWVKKIQTLREHKTQDYVWCIRRKPIK